MSSTDTATAKTVILAMVADAPGATYHMIMDSCIASLYMDFFTFSQCYNELLNGNLLTKVIETDGTDKSTADASSELLFITDGGKAILDDIRGTLEKSMAKYLEECKVSLNEQIRDRNRIKAYISLENDDFYAVLEINEEGIKVFSTKIRCSDRLEAQKCCESLKKNADDIRNSVKSFLP